MKQLIKIFFVFLLLFNLSSLNVYAEENDIDQETTYEVEEFSTDFLAESLVESLSYDVQINELKTLTEDNSVIVYDQDKELVKALLTSESVSISFIDKSLRLNQELILEIIVNFVTKIYSLNETYLSIEGDNYYFEETDGKTIFVEKVDEYSFVMKVIDNESIIEKEFIDTAEDNQASNDAIQSEATIISFTKGYYRAYIYLGSGIVTLLIVFVIFKKDRKERLLTSNINSAEDDSKSNKVEVFIEETINKKETLEDNINSKVIEEQVIDKSLVQEVSTSIENTEDIEDIPTNLSSNSDQNNYFEKEDTSYESIEENESENTEILREVDSIDNSEEMYEIPSLLDIDELQPMYDPTQRDDVIQELVQNNVPEINEDNSQISEVIELNDEITPQTISVEQIEIEDNLEELPTNIKGISSINYEIPSLLDVEEIEEEITDDINEEIIDNLLKDSIDDEIKVKADIFENNPFVTFINHKLYGLGEVVMEMEDCYYVNFNDPYGFKPIDKNDVNIKNKFRENK